MSRVTPQQIAAMAKARGLDPRAVLAVARQEGLGGGIGDNGTSFGPFQEHYGGAYPSSAPHGSPAQSQEWAWSPQGVAHALGEIASVAKGLSGKRAVEAIVTRFERPANPAREIQGALGAYGDTSASMPSAAAAGAIPAAGAIASGQANPVESSPGLRRQVTSALAEQIGHSSPDYSNVFAALQAEHATASTPSPQPTAQTPPQRITAGGSVPSLMGATAGLDSTFEHELEAAVAAAGGTKIRVDSGYRSPAHNAAVGGVPNSNHTTGHAADGAAYVPGRGWVPLGDLLQKVAGRFGLRSGDQPGFYRGGPDHPHVDDGNNVRHGR